MSFDLKLTNGDIVVMRTGALELVSELDKLSQDVVKIIVTPTGTVEAHPWYGSPLEINLVGKAVPTNIIESELSSSVNYAIKNLQTLQQLQEKTGQFLSPKEAISRITKIDIVADPSDARRVVIIIQIRTRSGEILEESVGVSL